MATKSKARLQAKSQRRQLAKLKSAGLYSGKIDGRKKPSKYQQSLIAKYKDVVTGKASVVKPKDAKSYKSIFQVVGDKVIVPRRKGEKIRITEKGSIAGERKVGGRKVRTYFKKVKRGETLAADKKPTMYFVPFIRGKDGKGKPIIEWKRFPNLDMLKQFMEGYDYKDWTDYVVKERVDPDAPYTNSDELNARLNKKIGNKKRRKIRFPDDDDGEE